MDHTTGSGVRYPYSYEAAYEVGALVRVGLTKKIYIFLPESCLEGF